LRVTGTTPRADDGTTATDAALLGAIHTSSLATRIDRADANAAIVKSGVVLASGSEASAIQAGVDALGAAMVGLFPSGREAVDARGFEAPFALDLSPHVGTDTGIDDEGTVDLPSDLAARNPLRLNSLAVISGAGA
jgi:hypothetical protein